MGRFTESRAESERRHDEENMRETLGLNELPKRVRDRVLAYARKLGFMRGVLGDKENGRWATRAQVALLAQAGGVVAAHLERDADDPTALRDRVECWERWSRAARRAA